MADGINAEYTCVYILNLWWYKVLMQNDSSIDATVAEQLVVVCDLQWSELICPEH